MFMSTMHNYNTVNSYASVKFHYVWASVSFISVKIIAFPIIKTYFYTQDSI